MSGGWRDAAACKSADPDLFFTPDHECEGDRMAREAAARAVCVGCPLAVRHECLEFGLTQRAGTWGGLTEDEIRQLKRRRRRYRQAAVA